MDSIKQLQKKELNKLTPEELLELYAHGVLFWQSNLGPINIKSMDYPHLTNTIRLLSKNLLTVNSYRKESQMLTSINIFTKEILTRRKVPGDMF